jgi:Co/Zn/Cd efflux system component
MSDHCCASPAPSADPRYRKVLWIALAVNAAMFVVEIAASAASGSASLAADAVDFAGDAANYGVSLAAIAAGGIWVSRAAFAKGLAMGAFGIGVLVFCAWRITVGAAPEAITMGIVGTLALVANLLVAWMLYAYREGDANMRSVWLCSRNDALSNLAVLAAAAGVFGTGSFWPDIAVAALMAAMALHSAASVLRQARRELQLADSVPTEILARQTRRRQRQ